jgi:hypothetical protein
MGVKTWIIVPILPYYLWAKPGEKTEWYNSVKLFRQEQYGDWSSVFVSIKDRLTKEIGNADTSRILDPSRKRTSKGRLGLPANNGTEGGLAGVA